MITAIRLHGIVLAVLGVVGTAACNSDFAPIHTIHTIHTDSAGIPIATAITPLWGPGEGWTVDDEPLVEIGTVNGAPEYQFAEVVGAVRLSTGHIVVADRGASELRGYDAEGRFLWRTGRVGEGPGEFGSLDFVGTMAGDSLVTFDNSLLRVQVFGPDGGLARTFPTTLPLSGGQSAGPVSDKAVAVVRGRLTLRYIDLDDGMPTGIVRWPNERVVALDVADGSTTSLLGVPGGEAEVRWRDDGGYSHGSYVFGNMPEFGGAAGHLAVIDTEAYSVRLVSPLDGTIEQIVRRDVAPRDVTGAVFDAHLDGIVEIVFPNLEDASPPQVDGLRQMWRERSRAPKLPVLRSVHVDAAGNLWVAPYYIAGAEPPPFEVHAPDGTWLGSVALPPGLQRGFVQYQAPYMEIGADYVLGVWTDELDVQYVRVYRLNR